VPDNTYKYKHRKIHGKKGFLRDRLVYIGETDSSSCTTRHVNSTLVNLQLF
jgi:hypothetical protein